MKTLSVVIPTFNRAETLVKTLTSLSNQTDKGFDVLVIDGGSTDKTHDLIKQFRKKLAIRYIVDTTRNLAVIRDRAWRETTGDIIASIDDDVVVNPHWISSIKKILRENKVVGVTGPTVIPQKQIENRDVFLFHVSKNPIIKTVGWLYFFLFMEGKKEEIGRVYSSGAWSPGSNFRLALQLKKSIVVDHLEACNFAIKRKVLEEVGGFDKEYKDVSEFCEMDLSFRIRKKRYILLFDPNVSVEHLVSRSGVFIRRYSSFSRLRNFWRFYTKTYYPKTITGYFQFMLYSLFLTTYFSLLELKGLQYKLKRT